eukprot:COSAG02_NODE_27310_length_612_cov_1.292398_1_plen_65_part_00
MADPVAVANAFVTHYNSLFDGADRTALAPLYVSARSARTSVLFVAAFFAIQNAMRARCERDEAA